MTPHVFTVASARFESARQIHRLAPGHRCGALHGHGFRATVVESLPDAGGPTSGELAGTMQRQQQLEQVLAPLNYAYLNDVVGEPSDDNLARWIHAKLDRPHVVCVALQSTAQQGVGLDRDGAAQIWRRYRFEAAHQLPNVPAGHKCGRMHGHGFDVVVQVRHASGSTPPIDYDHLDALWAPLHFELNYRCLNDIEGLHNPTSELVSSWLWARLHPQLPELSSITVFETAGSGASFDGNRYGIWKDFSLDSAVRVKRAPSDSPEARLHGHTYKLRLHLGATLDSVMGWVVDFGDVKTLFEPIFNALDHQPLHEIAELQDADTVSVAQWIHRSARARLPQLTGVDLFTSEARGVIVTDSLDRLTLPL